MENKEHNGNTKSTRNTSSLCPLCFIVFFVFPCFSYAQTVIDSFFIHGDIKVTIDRPRNIRKDTRIVFYALPNGNTTEQTMGKKMNKSDDWHFDIQHIRAQTRFLRETIGGEPIVVIYLENSLKSWPA